MILLDTHFCIWLILGDERVRKSSGYEVIKRANNQHKLFVPTIALWEMAMLDSKKRLRLGGDGGWLRNKLQEAEIGIASLTPEIAFESCNLPGSFHGDPADRIIVASARVNKAKLVTLDRRIVEYGKKGFVEVVG